MTMLMETPKIHRSRYSKEIMEPSSPPPELIIKGSKIHPKTIGLYESTKKLSLAPKIKNNMFKTIKKADDLNVFSNTISNRFLRYPIPGPSYYPSYSNESENKNNVVEVKVVVDGMINSLTTLNTLIGDHGNLPEETLNEDSFKHLVNYNSVHTLTTFVHIRELHESLNSILYLARNRFDLRLYVLKSANIDKPWKEINTLLNSNLYRLREAQILSSINHENIVRFHGCWFEQQAVFIQLEYMIGATLHYIWYKTDKLYDDKNMLSKSYLLPDLNPFDNKITVLSAKRLINHIVSALYYIHSELNIIHNNLNSMNIFACVNENCCNTNEKEMKNARIKMIKNVLDEDGSMVTFKLFDFGRSYSYYELPILRNCEKLLFLNHVQNDYVKDVFCLGLVLAEAFLGRNEFYITDFNNDTISEDQLTYDNDLNVVIKAMLTSYEETKFKTESLYNEVKDWV